MGPVVMGLISIGYLESPKTFGASKYLLQSRNQGTLI